MRVWVIVAAAGEGSRYRASGGVRGKLEEDLGGRSVLLRTVEVFTKREEVGGIVVAGPRDESSWSSFVLRHGDALGLLGATLCRGGVRERWETIASALSEVPAEATHVAVQDGARPNVSSTLLDRLFAAACRHGAVVPGVAVSDTLKRVSSEAASASPADPLDAILGEAGKVESAGRRVLSTVDRSGVVAVQTPQVFEAGVLRRAYAQDDLSSTDDAGLVERLGEEVVVVEGEVGNMKLTTPSDLPLLRALMGVRGERERPAHKRF